jgi:SLOG cluster2
LLEEIVLSVKAGQPVFLIGAFGGVAKLVIDLIHGNDREEATWDYQKRAPFAPEGRALYDQRGIGWMDYPEMVSLWREGRGRCQSIAS